ncbi:MAG: glycosyltransferase family 2 protein [Paracoccaceae bacterium]|nr:MAG: glycosyltransferase family 2 protein [Paracoccaceae bacterium]
MADTFTAVACMKNEGAFLLDWMAHHKALGFDHVVICTNDCADPTRQIALRLQDMGLARHHATRHWPATSIQRSALKQVRRYPEVTGAGWVWVCDADEYLAPRLGDGTVRALAAAASPEAEVISVPWRIFGPAGRWAYEDRPVTQLFRLAEPATGPGAPLMAYPKSLFRGDLPYHRIGIHAPLPRADADRPFRVELPGGVPLIPQHHRLFVQADFTHGQVNHYALRAGMSFLVKRDRGRVNHTGQDMGLDYWDRFDRAAVPCDALSGIAPAVAQWRDRLMQDGTLARLHAEAVAWHRARALRLAADPGWAAFAAAIRERLSRCASLPC